MNQKRMYRRAMYAWKVTGGVLVLGFLILVGSVSAALAVGGTNQPAGYAQNTLNASPQRVQLTAWEIVQMNDWLLWPFVILTTAGIMLIVYRGLVEHRDRMRSQPILQTKIRSNGIRNLVQMLRTGTPSRASRLLYQLILTFDKTNRAEPLGDDINQYLSAEKENFEAFNRLNGFLSEAAGALGLLGTVWGIFVTFWSGKMDGPTILQGMSIALVTTITGLIISLVLNMGGTYIYTLFNRQLCQLSNKAEELRQALLYLEKKANGSLPPEREEPKEKPVMAPAYPVEKETRAKKPLEIAFAEI
ncbi:MAG: MotA/TolQ/ExbB proton channel family protein [candidate division KSB1 bacterium]|nr:MotA/TolQ/ExbB proton channel family protein [candidate division KSB1 bacterium]MDZ7319089.1 MotA/TolQ/ExbB proton channel family protein [candidate division KSB1 bacterium]MDZ7340771.1 MotA/TolQ/ExbB proton channel family protein [candidate division KSB1 bacterium]